MLAFNRLTAELDAVLRRSCKTLREGLRPRPRSFPHAKEIVADDLEIDVADELLEVFQRAWVRLARQQDLIRQSSNEAALALRDEVRIGVLRKVDAFISAEDARAPVSAAVGRGLETRPAWAGGATIPVEGSGPEAFEAPFFDVEQLRPWHVVLYRAGRGRYPYTNA